MLYELTQYLLAAQLAWAPVTIHAFRHESPDQVVVRYGAIAQDLATVALEEEPLFAGEDGAARSALYIDAWLSYESGGYRADVDAGAPSGLGDHGRARCLAQIQLRPGEVLRDRRDCFRLAFARMRESFAACRFLELAERGAVYASGSCDRGRGASRTRMARATSWWAAHPFRVEVD